MTTWEQIYGGDPADPDPEPVDDLAVREEAERRRLEAEGSPMVDFDLAQWRERRERRAEAAASAKAADELWAAADDETRASFLWVYVHLGLSIREHHRYCKEAASGRLLTSFRPSRAAPLRERPRESR